jgi:predicted enzyme related to lactoylglutathione lyase
MTTKTEYPPGTPSWVDLSTTDPAAAQAFYGPLFGWTFDDQSDDPSNPYWVARVDGRDAAGVMAQPPEMRSAGVPPMWGTHVSVADVDATTAQVEAAGGTVIAAPADVMDVGRLAVIADPTGAVLCAWQAKSHFGASVVNEPGSFAWNELLTADVDRAAGFYHELFGWDAHPVEMGPMRYTEFRLGDQGIAGAQPPPMPGIPPVWVVYFAVADTDATVDDAKRRGAEVVAEPMDIPPGRMAVLRDPQGAVFNVIRLATPPG